MTGNEDIKMEMSRLVEKLPVNYQFFMLHSIDEKDVLRMDSFPYYNSSASVCKDFHRPISKLHDKEGRI